MHLRGMPLRCVCEVSTLFTNDADDSSVLVILLESSLSLWQSPPFCTTSNGHPGLEAGNFLEQVAASLWISSDRSVWVL